MRKPLKKLLTEIPIEGTHGGSGSRKLLLSSLDDISGSLEAMTQGFLPVGSCFDWHLHDGLDEFFLVIQGIGTIEFRDQKIYYTANDLIYIPSNTEHKITAEGLLENQFYFIRVKNSNADNKR